MSTSTEEPRALMLAAYMSFIRGVDIPETIEQARAVLIERMLKAEAELEAAHQLLHDGAPIAQGSSHETLRDLTVPERIREVFETMDFLDNEREKAELAGGTLQTALRQLIERERGTLFTTFNDYKDDESLRGRFAKACPWLSAHSIERMVEVFCNELERLLPALEPTP